MNVLQVMPEFDVAGAEVMCENLVYGLKDENINVLVVSLYNKQTSITDRLISSGVKVVFLNKKPGFDIRIFKRIKAIIKDFKPNIIHTHRYVLPYVVPIAKKIPIVHTLHSIASKEQGKLGRFLSNRWFKKRRVIPVALSENVKKSFYETYKKITFDIPVVLNGEDLSKITVKKDYSTNNSFNICHVGRFTEIKNQLLIVESLKKLDKVTVTFFGCEKTEYGNAVQKYVFNSNLTNRVFFKGISNNIQSELSRFDCFVLPSAYEGVPMSLIEAMAAGLPIIASNVGGIPNMVRNQESAILLDNICEKELNKAILFLKNSKTYRLKIGTAAKTRSCFFSYKRMAKDYIAIYKWGVE